MYKNNTRDIQSEVIANDFFHRWKNELFNQFLYEHSDGRKEFAKINVMPSEFNGDSQLAFAIALSIVGFVLILILDKLSPKENG